MKLGAYFSLYILATQETQQQRQLAQFSKEETGKMLSTINHQKNANKNSIR